MCLSAKILKTMSIRPTTSLVITASCCDEAGGKCLRFYRYNQVFSGVVRCQYLMDTNIQS